MNITVSWTTMTTCLIHLFLLGLISFGVHTVLIGLPPNNALIDSRFWAPGSEAVHSFTCDWGSDINWLFPPVYLVPRVIRHAQQTGAKGTLIVPRWVSAPLWLLLFPTSRVHYGMARIASQQLADFTRAFRFKFVPWFPKYTNTSC